MALTKVTYSMIEGAVVNALDFIPAAQHSAIINGTSTYDCTDNLADAIASLPSSGGTLYLSPGIYRGWISVRRDNVAIIGAGSSSTTLKLPDNASVTTTTGFSGAPIVVEFGTVDYPVFPTFQFTNLSLKDITLDGNSDNTPDPSGTDLLGWGFATTVASDCEISNVRIVNTWSGGVGHFINSDKCRFDNIYIYNCGFTTYGSGLGQHGFDINSCDYTTVKNLIVDSCAYGVRVLDNCVGSDIQAIIKDAVKAGLNYGANHDQGNQASSNKIVAEIYGGCEFYGAALGGGSYASDLDLLCDSLDATAFLATNVTVTADQSFNNTIKVRSYNCQQSSAIIYQNFNTYEITSYKDFRNSATGFAVEVYGSNNVIKSAVLTDSAVSTMRGIRFNSSSSDNQVLSLQCNNLVQNGQDQGTRNTIVRSGRSADVSTAITSPTLFLPLNGSVVPVSGTGGINFINPNLNEGRVVTLLILDGFDFYDNVVGSGSIQLSGGTNYTAPANTTITFCCVGTNWFEVCRE